MKRISYILFFLTTLFQAQPYAFPEAYGNNVGNITGGRGGNVYHVTNLLGDTSVGSFRWAISQPRPATIVFDVSGTIDLSSSFFQVSGSGLTIAGQTAPAGGITITSSDVNWKTRFWDVENMIIRYIRIRYQEGNGSIGIDIYGNVSQARNLIFDHLSISYAGINGFGLRGVNSYNVILQNSIIAECKTGSVFGDSDTATYSYDNSFNGNFFYNTSHRFPNPNSNGRVDVLNNVAHNPTFRLCSNTHTPLLNHINNYISTDWGSLTFPRMNRDFDNQANHIYSSGNIISNGLFTDPQGDNKLIWSKWNAGSETEYLNAANFTGTQHTLLGRAFPILTATESYNNITTNPHVGASKSLNADGSITANYDANDTDYLLKTSQGTFEAYTTVNNWVTEDPSFFSEQRYLDFVASVNSTPINTRPAGYDDDGDGIPNTIEDTTPGLDSGNASDGALIHASGYSNLEYYYLNKVDEPQVNVVYPLTPSQKASGKRTIKNKLIKI